MRKFFIYALCSVMLLSVFSCRNQDLDTNQNYELQSDTEIRKGLKLPKGSILNVNRVTGVVDFVLPENYIMIGETESGKLSRLYNGGSLTCKCTSKDGGCSPFVADGPLGSTMGCATGGCSTCVGKTKGLSVDKNAETGEVLYLNKINIVNLEAPTHVVMELDEYESLRNPTSAIMNTSFMEKEITKFIQDHQMHNQDLLAKIKDVNNLKDIGYTLAPVNIYGYRVYLPIDTTMKSLETNGLLNEVMAKYLMGDGGYSCKCDSGSSGCVRKRKNVLLGSATWCEAGRCTSCTMTNK